MNAENICPNCGEDLPRDNEPGWPCDSCTKAQPMNVWVSSWEVEAADVLDVDERHALEERNDFGDEGRIYTGGWES